MAELKVGLKGEASVEVVFENTAAAVGSGALEVFGTPSMIGLMEKAALQSVQPYLDEGQERTGTQRWLMENAWRYGFILRYPNGTTDITGIIYEPWHYRYVGEKFAREITKKGLTLEEYAAWRRGR